MFKKFSLILIPMLIITGCQSMQGGKQHVSYTENKISSEIFNSSSASQEEQQAKPIDNLSNSTFLSKPFQFYQMDLSDTLLPKPIIKGNFERFTQAFISPAEKTILLKYYNFFTLWDCMSEKQLSSDIPFDDPSYIVCRFPQQFLKNDTIYSVSTMSAVTSNEDNMRIEKIFDDRVECDSTAVDADGLIVSVDGTMKYPTFTKQLVDKIGGEIYLHSIYYDENLERYYALMLLFYDERFYSEEAKMYIEMVECAAAEYDQEGKLINYIVAEGFNPRLRKQGSVTNFVVAAGDRIVLSDQGIEFNFNDGSWRKTDYLKNLYRINDHPVYNGAEFQLSDYEGIHTLLGYENGQFQVFYQLNELAEGQQPYEVQTEQGPVQIKYEIVGTGPRKDFYFSAPCEEYTWKIPEHWEGLLGAKSYQRGAFKTDTDGTITFICPLPEDVDYIGEDINGFSYFYDRREL